MKKKRFNLGYYIKEGFSSIFTHGFMSFASICIILACLLIIGVFSLLVININANIADAEGKNKITAYIDENFTQEEAAALEGSILAIGNVSEVEFVSRDEAMENFADEYEGNVLEGIDASVFRHRFVIYMDDIALMSETKEALQTIEGVANINAYTEVAQGFVKLRNVVSIVSMILIAILLVISIFIISNTTKLATFDRRDEIAIMKMVGATNWFIRWPFIFQGFILGVFASLLAFLILWAGYEVAVDWIISSQASGLLSVVSFSSLSQQILAVFVGTGFLVGVLGSVVTIRNYLKV